MDQSRFSGTRKIPQPPTLDPSDPVDSLFAHVADPDPQHLFLLRAGSRAAYHQCGYTPSLALQTDAILAAPDDENTVASNRITPILRGALDTKANELLIEFLQVLAERAKSLPYDFLPVALDVTDEDLRAAVLPTLGARGNWLSQFQPQWQWVRDGIAHRSTADIEAFKLRWEEGAFKERLKILGIVRRNQPATALSWLSDSITQEKPEHRAQLLQALSDRLSSDDTEFLEKQLDDRSEAVRGVAAELLARLSDSTFATRMWERAQSMITRDANTGRLICTPPEELPKGWSRDGIPSKVPTGRGKRAVWTESILGKLRPMLWCSRFAMSPTDLIAGIDQDDFETPVLIGWTQAASMFAPFDPDQHAWLDPLWQYWYDREQRSRSVWAEHGYEPIADLFPHFAPDRREALLMPMLEAETTQTPTRFFQLLYKLQRPWSESFATRYLQQLDRAIERKHSQTHAWLQSLGIAIRSLPVSLIPTALAPWQSDSANHQLWSQRMGFEKLIDMLRARHAFYSLIDQDH